MAERSKALASGASREICVGSNPTLFTILFAFCSIPVAVVVVEISLVVWFFECEVARTRLTISVVPREVWGSLGDRD